MKTGRLELTGIFVLAVLIVVSSCATKRKAISEEDFIDAWSGTWINKEYSGAPPHVQKRINYPDGAWEAYPKITSTTRSWWGTSTILDHWIDSKGNIWYKFHWEQREDIDIPRVGFQMGKISNSGNSWEFILSYGPDPLEEWEPDNIRYDHLIFYSQSPPSVNTVLGH